MHKAGQSYVHSRSRVGINRNVLEEIKDVIRYLDTEPDEYMEVDQITKISQKSLLFSLNSYGINQKSEATLTSRERGSSMKKIKQTYAYLECQNKQESDIVDVLYEHMESIEKEPNEYVEIGQIVKLRTNTFLLIINHYHAD
ncbi:MULTISPECIES: hypothetical protein [Brevibacillus]|uniref:Uncharacterized protein n=1 Tax=Brevibacillus porteri TaxID=2126350 RepID=A0ABX5FNY7_9BACL|nr:hypothetical protein [Brevibacillus porteri]MED1797066.1 hypothetical protein [Brevibacillus porteri]MED2129819.1 hypothetical protein [Brevibacillus porteri]MED2744665.1 hypothetical protein [Brevibacillus porteri]MED2814458.1 hypothetical protein [Brevibacillus porteri]MED2893882.1 hypothetical protein [Brevibacillus porteri]